MARTLAEVAEIIAARTGRPRAAMERYLVDQARDTDLAHDPAPSTVVSEEQVRHLVADALRHGDHAHLDDYTEDGFIGS